MPINRSNTCLPSLIFAGAGMGDKAGMADDSLLHQRRLPARLTMEQTAVLLGFKLHDIPVLIRAKLLKPLGNPAPNAPKHFAAVDVEALGRDRLWLDRASKAPASHWSKKNGNRRAPKAGAEHSDEGEEFR